MAETARKRATYADLLQVPDPLVAEIVDGELYTSPRPASRHAIACSSIGMDLGGAFGRGSGGGAGGWWIIFEPELHLGENVMVPDLAGWRRERMPSIPDVPYFTLAPDWVCEVVSPHTARLDRVRKLPAYASSGVAYCWLVDPREYTLEVFRLVNGLWTLVGAHAGKAKVKAEPFEALELDLASLWIDDPDLPAPGAVKP